MTDDHCLFDLGTETAQSPILEESEELEESDDKSAEIAGSEFQVEEQEKQGQEEDQPETAKVEEDLVTEEKAALSSLEEAINSADSDQEGAENEPEERPEPIATTTDLLDCPSEETTNPEPLIETVSEPVSCDLLGSVQEEVSDLSPPAIIEPELEPEEKVEEEPQPLVDPVQESVVEDEPAAVVEEEAVEASAPEIKVEKEDSNLLIEPTPVEGDLAADLLGEEPAPVEPDVAVVADLLVDAHPAPIDVDDTKAFEQNDEETTEVSEPNPTLIDAPAVVDQDEKEVDSEPAAAAEAPIEIDEPVAVVEEETVEASATEIEVKKEDPNLLIETSYACIIA